MAISIGMGQDGVIRINLEGDMDKIAADIFAQELFPFMEAATVNHPLHIIVFAEKMGKLSTRIRSAFTAANRDDRMGTVTIIHPSRKLRVLAKFIGKATNKENIFFVSSEKEALATIAEQRVLAK